MRIAAIAAAILLGACAPIPQHTYSDYFDTCMTKARAKGLTNDMAFTQCSMVAFNACTGLGCKK